jgi:hypothetical protein
LARRDRGLSVAPLEQREKPDRLKRPQWTGSIAGRVPGYEVVCAGLRCRGHLNRILKVRIRQTERAFNGVLVHRSHGKEPQHVAGDYSRLISRLIPGNEIEERCQAVTGEPG